MSCPQTMILQISRSFKLLRRRAWDKGPVTITRLTTCNRVKTINPEYKNTQQDLTGWKLSFSDSQGYASFQGYVGHQQQVFIQLYQGRWVFCTKALSNYSLLVSGFLLSGFKIP